MAILISILTLIFGCLLGYFFGRNSAPSREGEINDLKATLREKEQSFQLILSEKENKHLQDLRDKDQNLESALKREQESFAREISSLKENHRTMVENMEKNHQEAVRALKEQFAESSNAMSEQLKAATEQMLRQRQEEFSASSGEKLGQILEPLKMSLKSMQEKVNENTTQNASFEGKLTASIKNLLDHTEAAQASADRLASMLKGNSRHQGEWGERVLKEILESLNLKEGIHFEVQHTFTDENGAALKNEEGRMGRPDVVLHLDREKDVIIDSKVSLSAYLQYMEAENDDERQEALRKHIASIEKHVNELVRKDYSGYVKAPRMRLGYVIMFVPNTSALLLATKSKPTLWREAMERDVYIADEQTLYAALKIVGLTWQQIQQSESHAKVFELAEEMLQRVGQFMKYYNDIGESLSKATKNFEEGRKKLSDSGQSIPKTAQKLLDLGVRQKQKNKRLGSGS